MRTWLKTRGVLMILIVFLLAIERVLLSVFTGIGWSPRALTAASVILGLVPFSLLILGFIKRWSPKTSLIVVAMVLVVFIGGLGIIGFIRGLCGC